jgi:flagellar protein FliS
MIQQAYLEAQVMSADPVELICLLYDRAVDRVREARRRLASREIAERAAAIGDVISIVGELNASLDHSAGGAISANLAQLYNYLTMRLTEGNVKQQDAPLAEVENLLLTLAEAWHGMRAQLARPAETETAPPVSTPAWQATGEPQDAHAWSA